MPEEYQHCPACQAINPFGATYCRSCGRPLPKPTSSGQFMPRPKPVQGHNSTPWILSGVALLMVVVLIVGLWKPGFVWILVDELPNRQSENSALDTMSELDTVSSSLETDFKQVWQEEVIVNGQQTSTSLGNVYVDFGEFILEEDEELKIIAYETEDYEDGLSVASYDISLGERSELYDVARISLPYDVSRIDQANEAISVGAKYFNEEEQVWEDIPYTVNTETKTVDITTTHLSKYSVFMVRNEFSRMAYISTVFAPPISSNHAQEIVQEYIDNGGEPGTLAENAGWEVVEDYINTSNVNNLANAAATLKDFQAGALPGYTFEITSELGSLTRWVGLGMTFYTLANDGVNCVDDHTKRKMVTNVTKNLMFNAVDFFGTSALQVSFIGLIAIDYALTSFGETMLEERLQNVETVYQQYYKQSGVKRGLKDWRRRLIGYIEDNPKDPQAAMRMLEDDINEYTNRFWKEVNTEEYNALAGEAGLKIASWPNTRDQEQVVKHFQSQIHKDLHPVYISVQNYLKNKVQEDALRRLGKVRDYLNQQINIEIIDLVDEDDKNIHAGYTIRFEPLAEGTNSDSWTGIMKEEGKLRTKFTLLGHMQSGMPNKLAFYKPGDQPDKDQAEFSVEFSVSKPLTVIEVPDQDLRFEDILGTYDISQIVEGFESEMMDGLLDQMQIPEGYEDIFDAEAYKQQYESAMEDVNTTNEGEMTIEKIGEDTAKVALIFTVQGQRSEVLYQGTWDNGILHLIPAQQMAGGNWDLKFMKDNKTIQCSGESNYDSSMASYSFSLTGIKRK